jgi:transcription elongation factor GreA
MRDEEGQNMEMTEEIVLTPEGYELKKKKLEEYRRILYEELPKKLKLAKEHGAELRENKEYLDIKREQDYYEAEVRRLEELLEKAVILDESQISTKAVGHRHARDAQGFEDQQDRDLRAGEPC